MAETNEVKELRAHKGPQWSFSASRSTVVIFGGSAGGGKSRMLVQEPTKYLNTPKFTGIIFRRRSTELQGGGGIWDEALDMYPSFGGIPRESPRFQWTFPDAEGRKLRGGRMEFSHLQHEKDVHSHQSKAYAYIGFDEVTQFTSKQFWYMLSRLRSVSRVKAHVRAACNPDPNSFVRELISWWIGDPDCEDCGDGSCTTYDHGFPNLKRAGVIRWGLRIDGVISWAESEAEDAAKAEFSSRFPELTKRQNRPLSFTFIPALLKDNPTLTEGDPDYEAKLLMLQKTDRERLMLGNWNAREVSGEVFKRVWFEVVEEPPDDVDVIAKSRGWDLAATEVSPSSPDPDWSAGVLGSRTKGGTIYIEHVERFRETPGKTESNLLRTATHDGKKTTVALWQDPGGAGKSQIATLAGVLLGFNVKKERASHNKLDYAKPVSSAAEHGKIKVVRGAWNEAFFRELESFPQKGNGHDDQVDALSRMFMQLVEKSSISRLRALSK